MIRRIVGVVLVALISLLPGCDSSSSGTAKATPLPADGSAQPGGTYSLDALIAAGATGWSVVETSGCGSVDQAGIYTAPPCPTPAGTAFHDATCHVQAKMPDGTTGEAAISLRETVISVSIVCALVGGQPPCLTPPVTVAPGGTVTFIASEQWTCHSDYTAQLP